MWCDPTIGTGIVVTAGNTATDIDFTLVSALLFADDFEDGTTTAWSSTTP